MSGIETLERVIGAIESEAVEDFRERLVFFIDEIAIRALDGYKEGWEQARELVEKFATEEDR